ncbi:MAG: acetate/propionate family kinase [Actinomycetota bacterium]|nr:acetate/propionate family kinase [Actinomycetota bacterium]
MRILTVNAGSSSVKLTLLEEENTLAERELSAPRAQIDEAELLAALEDGFGDADAVGHRIVHGGEEFTSAVVIDDGVESALRRLCELAPLHQAKSLAALDAVSRALPALPAVACFDTAFHHTLTPAATTYALPIAWREQFGVRRYGFHGLSHAWVARRAPELLGRPATDLRLVSCHLGAGASLCAIAGGRSVDTTMGFTPLDGLVMATRSGSVDPGLLLWLLEHTGLSERQVAAALEHESGLLALAGSADMREVLSRVDAGNARARAALDVYSHRLRGAIAAMAAALGGIDAIAFTGGVGEHAPLVRSDAVAGLGFLGLAIDERANRVTTEDADITRAEASARTLVITAREDLEIARQVRDVLTQLMPLTARARAPSVSAASQNVRSICISPP